MHRLALALPLIVAVTSGGALARPNVGDDGIDRLAHYQVLTYTDPGGNGINKGKAIGVFDATPDEVFRVCSDYERYPEFAPRIVGARVIDRKGDDGALVLLNTDLPWPVSKAWVEAQFEHERLDADTFRIRFFQLRGSMRRYFGSILIEPWQKWKGGGTSVVTYELLAEPDTAAPKRLINARMEDVVAKYVHFLRQHINDLRRLGRIHPQLPPAVGRDLAAAVAGPRQPRQVTDVARKP